MRIQPSEDNHTLRSLTRSIIPLAVALMCPVSQPFFEYRLRLADTLQRASRIELMGRRIAVDGEQTLQILMLRRPEDHWDTRRVYESRINLRVNSSTDSGTFI